MDIKELAEYALRFFEQKTRPDGTSFWSLTDRHPTWVYDLVRNAHETMLPDDYKYEYVFDTLDLLSEGWDPEDGAYDLEADVYNQDLLRWLGSHGERIGFVDEAVSELGHHPEMGIMGDIMMGQAEEKRQVWQSVVTSLRERIDAIEMGEPEEFRSKRPGSRKEWHPRA